MKNIVLIGFMGTGKSSVGKILSEKLGFKFIDVDEVIEKTTGMKISEIFSRFGEPRFRDIESEVINLITKKRLTGYCHWRWSCIKRREYEKA